MNLFLNTMKNGYLKFGVFIIESVISFIF